MNVTDQDRATAMRLLYTIADLGIVGSTEAIAAVLASEREMACAPFLALAHELYTNGGNYSFTPVQLEIADRISAIAEEES